MQKFRKPIVIAKVFIEIGGSIESGYILSELWELYQRGMNCFWFYEDFIDDQILNDLLFQNSIESLISKNLVSAQEYKFKNETDVSEYKSLWTYGVNEESLTKAIEKESVLSLEESIVIKRSHIAIGGGLTEGYILSWLTEWAKKTSQTCCVVDFPVWFNDRSFKMAIEKLEQQELIYIDRCQSSNTQEYAIQIHELHSQIEDYFKEAQ